VAMVVMSNFDREIVGSSVASSRSITQGLLKDKRPSFRVVGGQSPMPNSRQTGPVFGSDYARTSRGSESGVSKGIRDKRRIWGPDGK
jgi:hypothetical protein